MTLIHIVINNISDTGLLDELKMTNLINLLSQNLGSKERHSNVNFKDISYLVTSKLNEIYMLGQMMQLWWIL